MREFATQGMRLALDINQLECKVDSRQYGSGRLAHGRDMRFALTSHAPAMETKH